MAQKFDQKERFPKIALLGKTGAGKSSLINAITESNIRRIGITPTTQRVESIKWSHDKQTIALIDTPGGMEADNYEIRLDALFDALAQAHVVLWIIGYPDRALSYDLNIVNKIYELEPEIPIYVIGSGVDRAFKKNFDPDKFNFKNPKTDEEKKIKRWSDYLKEKMPPKIVREVVICSAGENANDKQYQYNLKFIYKIIENSLPEVTRLDWIRTSKVLGSIETKAQLIIAAATAGASAAAIIPIPIADAVVITGIQVSMIISLSTLYGQTLTWSTAFGLVSAALAAVIGPMAFQQIMKFVPGLGSFIGPMIAAPITIAIGEATNYCLKNGYELTPSAIKKATKRAYKNKKNK